MIPQRNPKEILPSSSSSERLGIGTHVTALFLVMISLVLHIPAFYWGLPSTTRTLATFHADEQISYYSLEKWRPKQLKFPPGDALYWGTLHLHTLAASLKLASLVGYIHEGNRAYLLQDLSRADRLYRVGRGLSVAFGLACVGVAFWAGRRLFGVTEGLVLAALSAWTPLQLIATFYVRPDCILLLWGFVIMRLSVEVLRNPMGPQMFWAAFVCGLAAATKYTGGIFLVMPAMAWLLSRERPMRALGYLSVGSLIGFCVGCPVVIFDFRSVAEMLRRQYSGAWLGPTPSSSTSWPIEYVRYFFPYALTWPLTLCIFGGFAWFLVKGQKVERWLAISFILTYAVITAPKRQYVTYAVPLLPYLLVFAARSAGVAMRGIRTTRTAMIWVAASAIAVTWPLVYSAAYMRLFWDKDARVEASEWLSNHVPAGAPVGIAKSFYWTPPALRAYATAYRVFDPSVGDPPFSEQARLLKSAPVDYIVLSDFETRNFERDPAYAAVLKEIMTARSNEVARFENHAHLGLLSWPKDNPPWDWMVPYPTLRIFRMNILPQADKASIR